MRFAALAAQIASQALLWPMTWRLVGSVSALLMLIGLNERQALSAISGVLVAQPASRKALGITASSISFLGVVIALPID
jgi:hypothetical protein